jgi:hypothetical protein
MIRHRHALLVLLAGLVSAPAFAEQAASDNHGYFGVGLMLESNNSQTPLGDFNSTGGGLIINGAGIFAAGSGIGFGANGSLDFGSRTDSDTDETISEAQFGFDGGVILADLLYLSLGLQFLNQTPDSADITTTYTVVPLGIGVLKGTETGYFLAQVRFGGGQASTDQDSATEDLGYFGLRLAGQTGSANGLQFMGGLEFDTYDFSNYDATDNYFRFFFGLGFGG